MKKDKNAAQKTIEKKITQTNADIKGKACWRIQSEQRIENRENIEGRE